MKYRFLTRPTWLAAIAGLLVVAVLFVPKAPVRDIERPTLIGAIEVIRSNPWPE